MPTETFQAALKELWECWDKVFIDQSNQKDYKRKLFNVLENGFDSHFSEGQDLFHLLYRGPDHDEVIHINDTPCLFSPLPVVERRLPESYDAEKLQKCYNLVKIPGFGNFIKFGSIDYQFGNAVDQQETCVDEYDYECDEDDLYEQAADSPFDVFVEVVDDTQSTRFKAGPVYLVRRPGTTDDREAFGTRTFNIAKVADSFRHFISPSTRLKLEGDSDNQVEYLFPDLPLQSSHITTTTNTRKRPFTISEERTSQRRRLDKDTLSSGRAK